MSFRGHIVSQDVGTDLALLRTLREFQVAEAGAVVLGDKLHEARQAGKAGLNTTTRVAATATQTVHGQTLGKVCARRPAVEPAARPTAEHPVSSFFEMRVTGCGRDTFLFWEWTGQIHS